MKLKTNGRFSNNVRRESLIDLGHEVPHPCQILKLIYNLLIVIKHMKADKL